MKKTFIITSLLIPLLAFSAVDYIAESANDIVRGSHELSADGTKYAKLVSAEGPPAAAVIYSDYQATLANGAEIDSGWIDMQKVDKIQFSGNASVSGMTMTIDSRANESQAALSTPVTYTDGVFYLFNIIARQRYMRFHWANNTGAGVTNASMEIKQTFGSSDKLSVFPVGVNPNTFSQAALVQAIVRGKQPDGDYVAIPADGTATTEETALGSNALNGAISDSVTTITVDSTTGFASTGTIEINDELMTYTGTTSTTFTGLTRGAYGSTAAAHSDNDLALGAFVSPWTDSDGWNSIAIVINTDVVSKFLGICIEFTDNTQAAIPSIKVSKEYSFSLEDIATGNKTIRVPTTLDGFRIKYVNGEAAQSNFFLDTSLRVTASNVKFNKGGGLLVSDFNTEAALGLVSNYEINDKFGRVKGIDAADSAVDVWAFADDGIVTRANTKTFPTSAVTPYFVSSSASDTSVSLKVSYIDSDGFDKVATIALNGRTGVSLGDTALDVNRISVSGSTAALGIIYAATANNFTLGLPTTPSEVLASAPIGYNQSQLSHFTVPKGKTLIIKDYSAYISRANGSAGSADLTLRIKEFGGVSKVKREFFPTSAVPIVKSAANIVVPERSQIVWQLDDVSDGDTQCSIDWDYELVDN